jgi:ATP-binding cassette subfamily G (WHITE) protein 2 (PDR)
MGYRCPERQTTGDFLTSLTNPAERVVEPGFESRVPRTADEFADVWRHSEERRLLLREISDFEKEFPIDGPQLHKFIASRKAQQSSLMSDIAPSIC